MHPIAAVQNEYLAALPRQAEETRETTRTRHRFVAYAPLGRGFLTGAIPTSPTSTGVARAHPRFQEANFAHNRALVARIEAIAKEKGCTPAQIALAWLWRRVPTSWRFPARETERLEENLGALIVKLGPADVKRLSDAIPVGAAAGTRYPAGGMKGVYV